MYFDFITNLCNIAQNNALAMEKLAARQQTSDRS